MISTIERVGLTAHQWLYEKTDGRIGARLGRRSMLLLRHVGRKTGQPRISALLYVRDGDNYAVIASKGGDPKHPGVVSQPHRESRRRDPDRPGTDPRAGAGTPKATSGRAIWAKANDVNKGGYDTYQKRTDRTIPVVVLERDNERRVVSHRCHRVRRGRRPGRRQRGP